MNNSAIYTLLGADARLTAVAHRWEKQGHTVRLYANGEKDNVPCLEDALADADVIVLPVPWTRDGRTLNATVPIDIETLYALTPPDALVLCGGECALPNAVNYAQSDVFQQLNALPTAEGAIQTAMETTPFTLAGSNVLVVGAGRIGKLLAHKLKAFDAKVTVSARKDKDLAELSAYGFDTVHTSQIQTVCPFDIVFNTVPAPVITADVLRHLSSDSVVIDLASRPGGTNFEAAKSLGIRTVHALGLPGKVAPRSAAEILICVLEQEISKKEQMKHDGR